MTKQQEIIGDPNYIAVLDHGFVGLVATMGDDSAIVSAARVSYGAGTKTIREDRGLIRYLFRHHHTSPVEMCDTKYHIRCPIFVMRQLVRHRTHAMNEYSGRYSIMSDEFYVPDITVIQPQSSDNKQGRAGDMSALSKDGVQWVFNAVYESAYDCYNLVLGEKDRESFIQGDYPYGAYDQDDPVFDQEYPGIARELARSVLPVGNYTELYWKQNLHNLFHLLTLRLDAHAQYEVRVFAHAMYTLIKPIFPIACEAFEDYILGATTLSRMETDLLKDVLKHHEGFSGVFEDFRHDEGVLCAHYGLSKREFSDFRNRFSL
jgi:thymidylate synthase (FAD)